MRVIHIIPSAYNYFDDIRAAAFELVEKSSQFGIDAEAFTLQYGSTITKSERESIKAAAPTREFKGMSSIEDAIASFDNFDVVHVHIPLLGAAGKLLTWRRAHPDMPLVITYYRPPVQSDLFSYFIWAYNAWYTTLLCAAATVMVFQPLQRYSQNSVTKNMVYIDTTPQFGDQNLTEVYNGVQLLVEDIVTAKYALVYRQLLAETPL